MSAPPIRIYPRPQILDQIPAGAHAVIEASAGTGKTFTIEHLVIEILLTTDCTIEEILVVTFTEKATTEVRQRVRALLVTMLDGDFAESDSAGSLRGWKIDQQARERLQAALGSFDRAPISTIHGFCARILAQHAFALGRILEGRRADARVIFDRAFKECLRRRLAVDDELAMLLVAWRGGTRPQSIDKLCELLYRAATARAPTYPRFDRDALVAAWARVAAALNERGVVADLRAASTDTAMHGNKKGAFDRGMSALIDLRERVTAIGWVALLECELAGTLGGLTRAVGRNAKKGERAFPDDLLAGSKEALAAVDALLATCASLPAALHAALAAPVAAQVTRIKSEDGLFDFDDMIAEVADALAGERGEDLARALALQYRHALIDEFQDTDELQWDIFERAFFRKHRDMPAERQPRLRVVGDPKQAIYAFRGADLPTYMQARAAITANATPVALAISYRSTAAFLQALQQILDSSAPPEFFASPNEAAAPLECGRKELRLIERTGERDLTPICVMQDVGEKFSSKRLSKLLIAAYAGEIKRILGSSSTSPIAIVDAKGCRFLQARDIFILTRSKSESIRAGQALRAVGVPFAFYKQEGLWATDEAADLRDVLAAIAGADDAAQEPRVRRALLTIFFAFAAHDLIDGDASSRAPDAVALLAAWRQLANERRFDLLFSAILQQSGVVLRLRMTSGGQRQLVNLEHIAESLARTAVEGSMDIAELVAHLGGLISGAREQEEDSGDLQRLESEEDAVQIMTMHKSKGLEAAVVFLLGGFHPGSPRGIKVDVVHTKDGGRLALLDRPDDELAARLAEERDRENERLFYVAMTRARARLYLPASFQTNKDGALSLKGAYACVNRRLNALLAGATPAGFEVRKLGGESAKVQAESRDATAEFASWSPDPRLLALPEEPGGIAAFRQAASGPYFTSSKRLKALVERAGMNEHVARRAGSDDLPRGKEIGNCLHEILEHLDFATLSADPHVETWSARADVIALFDSTMRSYAIASLHRTNCMRLIHRVLTAPIALPGVATPLCLAAIGDARPELEFTFPIPEAAHPHLGAALADAGHSFKAERGYVSGYIDLVFTHAGRAYVLDWKSDFLDEYSEESMRRQVADFYQWQEWIYSLALARMVGVHDETDHRERFGGILYVFLRGGVTFRRPDLAELAQIERKLEEMEKHG